jgi:tetratricopeptide (TPR) repeat protein
MRRQLVGFLFTLIALAQPQRNDFQSTYLVYHQARQAGRFEEATAKREELRRMVETTPADSAQLAGCVQMTAQLYESSGMYATARVITEQALDRMTPLGESAPGRIQLLNSLANYWEQDRNLLKAAGYLEKAAAASEKAPKTAPQGLGQVVMMRSSHWFSSAGDFAGSGLASTYERMARMYRRLGRPDSLNQVLGKLQALGPQGAGALASIYQGEGRFDDAAAVYRKQVDSVAKDPTQAGYALQSLANLYQQQERYGDAASTLQQAIGDLQAGGMQNSQIVAMQRQLAQVMVQASQTEAADRIYQRLLADQGSPDWAQSLMAYTNHLTNTQRATEAESLLKAYLQDHADLPASQQSMYFNTLANIARQAGKADQADRYARLAVQKQTTANLNAPKPEQNAMQRYMTLAQGAIGRDDGAAFSYAMQALDAASRAGAERDQSMWRLPSIASRLAPDKAEQLWQRVLALTESWSSDSMQMALQATQGYVQFLVSQENPRDEAPAAIERYRRLLIASRGQGTGWQEETLRMTIDLESRRGALGRAVIVGQDLVALEESLNGTTSVPYLHALETLARSYQAANNVEQALALRRQAIGISDLISAGNDTNRVSTRIEAAWLLVQLERLDEAKSVAADALTVAQSMPPAQVQGYRYRAEQILKTQKR